MKSLKIFVAAAAIAAFSLAAAPRTEAQISIRIGVEPNCPYGYYDYSPYGCAPYGYYGPEWFNGGVFVGAGRWFHGGRNFRGHVDNHYDPRRGYRGERPQVGQKPDHADRAPREFKGNESRDGRGHAHKPR